jgi:predicted ATP-dependent endonuclease of OLD family
MRLVDFQIKNYKVIDDTGPVVVNPKVTALVGKNESGKSAVLKAMWKSQNVADAVFDKLYDYPRDRYSRDRRGTQKVTVLKFELSPEETDELVAHLPQPVTTKPKTIIYTTYYSGEDNVRSEVRFDSDLKAGLSGAEVRTAMGAVLEIINAQGGEDLDPVRSASATAFEQIDEQVSLWEKATITALETFSDAATTWINADPSRGAWLARKDNVLPRSFLRSSRVILERRSATGPKTTCRYSSISMITVSWKPEYICRCI